MFKKTVPIDNSFRKKPQIFEIDDRIQNLPTEIPVIVQPQPQIAENYDHLLERFLGNNENIISEVSRMNYDENKTLPNLPVGTVRILKEGLTGLLAEFEKDEEEEEKENRLKKTSIGRSIFSVDQKPFKQQSQNNNPAESQSNIHSPIQNNSEELQNSNLKKKLFQNSQESLVENFMSLMNNAILSINQAILKNLSKVPNEQEPQRKVPSEKSRSSEDEPSNSHIPNIFNNYPFQFNYPGIANYNAEGLMPMGFHQAMMPINPNNYLNNISFTSESRSEKSRNLSSNTSEILKTELKSGGNRENSLSEGQESGMNSNQNEDLWISAVFNNKNSEEEEDVSEGEIKLP